MTRKMNYTLGLIEKVAANSTKQSDIDLRILNMRKIDRYLGQKPTGKEVAGKTNNLFEYM